ncbi:MAG: tetratricopeptide repeat protein [Deltaproteobacteria bacterium]|nr:tetratricopeptide repeat protein [Deltaproteobacteria bacterium]
MSKIISITTHESKSGTTINVLGDGRISKYITTTYKSPSRIVVDIFCNTNLFGMDTIDVKSPSLKRIRIGYHPKKIRLVLDIKGADIPGFSTITVDKGLTVSLLSGQEMDKKPGKYDKIHTREPDKKMPDSNAAENLEADVSRPETALPKKESSNMDKTVPVGPDMNKTVSVSSDMDNKVKIVENETENVNVEKKQESSEENGPKKVIFRNKLTRAVSYDGRHDTTIIQKCLDSYKAQDWSGAIENLKHLIKTYPKGRYAERAYFLLAESSEKLNSQSISDHFNEIKEHYEDAISRYPESVYVPDALLGIGNMYLKSENYFEALGYYNLVIKKDRDSMSAVNALMNKAKILILKKKRKDALSVLNVLEGITSMSPDMPERMETRELKAKLLYEMNRFHDSLNVLNELMEANPENIFKYPEISLYSGYNYYQLGVNHLVLTQIGDTYRNESLAEDAVKFYRMVLERYPKTDGAIICQIRLAEQQEELDWMAKTRKEIGSPKKIYKNIINNSIGNDEKKPLVQLSLLKLAVTYQKDKEYKKSLEVLKELQKKYPETSLKKEMRHALSVAIEGILKQEIKEKKYINVIDLYLKENELFLIANAPELFLPVARAFNMMNLEKSATEVFRKADILLPDSEKPPDLLFFVGKYFFARKNFNSALNRFDILIDNQSEKYASDVYRLKGNVLMKQKRYEQAAKTLSVALQYPVTKCERAVLLIEKAKALAGSNSNEKALKAINMADGIKRNCNFPDCNICREIGDVYLNLGYASKALTSYNQAVDMAKEKSDKISLKFKVAQCYLLLNKKEVSLDLYNKILSLNDPFWSNLAQEKIEEINFNSDVISGMLD